jgi:hypothetical protein
MTGRVHAAATAAARPAAAPAADRHQPKARPTGSGAPDPVVRALIDIVRAEYAEMPGLSVTPVQAARLWAVDRATCDEVFRRLIAMGVVRRTRRGTLVRA